MNGVDRVKKRRGRPPKYLNVWQGQHLMNSIEQTHLPDDQDEGRPAVQEYDSNEGDPSPQAASGLRDSVDPSTLQVTVKSEAERPTDSSLIRNNEGDSDHQRLTNLPLVTIASQSRVVAITTSSMSGAAPAMAVVPPVKRRPGRPPGSTKKLKVNPSAGTRGPPSVQEEFSLRKFFEAGGRDYNSYLMWLKTKQDELEAAVTATARRSKPDMDPVSPGVQWSQQLKVSPANICLPGSPLVAMTPPLVSRLPAQTGILGSLSPECSPSDTQQFSTTAPISLSSPFSPKPPETAALKQPIAMRMPDDQKGFTAIPQGVVLDLSGKKRQSQITSVDDVWKVPGAVNDVVIGSDVIGTCFPRDIRSWGVNEVASFVSTIPGCQEYSETFKEHRIDGTSLAHLSEEHLLHVVKMKLGPAIRLRIAVSRLHVSCGV